MEYMLPGRSQKLTEKVEQDQKKNVRKQAKEWVRNYATMQQNRSNNVCKQYQENPQLSIKNDKDKGKRVCTNLHNSSLQSMQERQQQTRQESMEEKQLLPKQKLCKKF